MKNFDEYQVSNYEGVTVRIGNSVSKEIRERIIEGIKPEKFDVLVTQFEQSYFVGKYRILTAPLNKNGYLTIAEDDNLIFVNSKLPKAERAKVVRHFIQQAEVDNAKAK